MATTTTFTNTSTTTIADQFTAITTVTVAGTVGVIQRVSVTLTGLTHSHFPDLDFLLVAPDGRGFNFMSDAGWTGRTNVTFTLADTGSLLVPENADPLSGTYLPTDRGENESGSNWGLTPSPQIGHPAPVGNATFTAAFGGGNANGVWSLFIDDDVAGHDGSLGSWSVTITTGAAPTVSGGSANGFEDTPIIGTLPSGSDADNDPLTYQAAGQPAHGTVKVNPNGTFVYTPYAGYSGSDSFTFVVNDGAANSSVATYGVSVANVNDAPTFTNGPGKLTDSYVPNETSEVSASAIQDDGKIIVVGATKVANQDYAFALTRYNTNGSLDTGFGTNGRATLDIDVSFDRIDDVSVQPDGKIVVAGSTATSGGLVGQMAVARYNANGTLDTSFGTNGITKISISTNQTGDQAHAMVLQPDGKIVIVGTSSDGPPTFGNFAAARLNADGTLDTSFGSDGTVEVVVGNSTEEARAVALQPDGKIVMTGDFYNLANDKSETAVVRLNPDGTVDSVVSAPTTNRDFPTGIALQPDGNILVAGYTVDDVAHGTDVLLQRFDSALNPLTPLDTTFGTAGRGDTTTDDDFGSDILLLRDGKILVAGTLFGTDNQFALWRYNANGTLDTTFGNGGKVVTAFAGNAGPVDIKQAPDGKIVLVGTSGPFSETQIAVARYNLDGTVDRTFAAVNTLGGAAVFTEGGAPVVLDGDVAIYDEELPPGGNFNGGSLTLSRIGGASADDVFGASGNLWALTTGSALIVGGDTIGTVTQNSGGTLILTFNTNATEARVDAAMRLITYQNTSDAPPASVDIDWAFSDGSATGTATKTVTIARLNDAPVNTVPDTLQIDAHVATAITGLAIADVDAGAGSMTTTLSVEHGILAVVSAGGAAVSGSGTATVTLTGTVAQINTTLSAANNVRYTGATNYTGDDALTVTTSDGGNAGSGGAQSDTDTVTIDLGPYLIGTPGDDSYDALRGREHIDGGLGLDTIVFDFKLVDATVRYIGNEVIIEGPSSRTVLTGFEVFKFSDGTVNNADGSPLVDDLFYYSRYHDVWAAHADADAHYNNTGWHESRDPNAFFSTSVYLSANPDVMAGGGNPLSHFDALGWKEGRVPSITFDPGAYLTANPDVAASGVDPLRHYLESGYQEGRQPIAPSELIAANGFDYVYYLNHNADVAASGVDPFQHFQTVGWKEGRNPNALFDTDGYLNTYADVKASGVNPLDHYNSFGWHEGRDPSVGFDTTSYLAAYNDVDAAHTNPLTHFLHYGIHEGRSAFPDGVWG